MDVVADLTGIPTQRTDQALPGVPLGWFQPDAKSAVPILGMGASLKLQLARAGDVIVEQTAEITADDVIPNWVLEKFTDATLLAIQTDMDTLGCLEFDYDFVPMFRRLSDSAWDIFMPPWGFKFRFVRAPA